MCGLTDPSPCCIASILDNSVEGWVECSGAKNRKRLNPSLTFSFQSVRGKQMPGFGDTSCFSRPLKTASSNCSNEPPCKLQCTAPRRRFSGTSRGRQRMELLWKEGATWQLEFYVELGRMFVEWIRTLSLFSEEPTGAKIVFHLLRGSSSFLCEGFDNKLHWWLDHNGVKPRADCWSFPIGCCLWHQQFLLDVPGCWQAALPN